jgi:hypothetical protein
MHIYTGNHLAFGYMDFPPVLGLLAFFQNLLNLHSIDKIVNQSIQNKIN